MTKARFLSRPGRSRPVGHSGRRAAVLVALVLVGACAVGPAWSQATPSAPPLLRAPEAGLPFITAFAPSDYGAAEPNWAVEQDARGVVYAGNGAGVLEYDGAAWRLIALPNRATARSLARDGFGRVWVGGVGDLGFLAPDARGRMAFVSLRAHVPAADRDFADVWSTHATAQGVYFRTSRALFRWDGRTMHVWRPAATYHSSFLVGGVLYVRERERGLLRMEPAAGTPGRLRLVPGGERFAQTRIYGLLPFDGPSGSRLLVGTREEGLFVSDGARFVPFRSDADGVLAESGLYAAAALPGGRFALGTRYRGIYVIDRRGRLVLRLDRANGLPDDTILALYDDGGGTLWVGLSSGLARVELDTPATRFGEAGGVLSTPLALARHAGRLVAANAHGGPAALEAGAFRPLANGPSHSPGLLAAAGDLLLAGSNDGLHLIRGGLSEPLPQAVGHVGIAFALHAWSRDPQTVFVGDDRGVAVMRRAPSGWAYRGRVPGLDMPVRRIAEARDGALWLGGASGRIARVRLPGEAGAFGPDAARVTLFGAAEGLPEGSLAPFRVGGEVYISAPGERVFRVDEATGGFVDDPTFARARSGHPLAQFALREAGDGRVWISSTYGAPVVARPRAEGGYAFETLHRFRRNRIHDVFLDAEGVVWMMGARELVRYETRRAAAGAEPLPPLVRRVTTADSLLYDGAGAGTRADVPFGAGAVRFAFAAPGEAGQARYRTRLEGFDAEWSAWTEATERTYTNLPPGRYRFLVEAEGRPGAGAFELSVLPPWYRTGWAGVLFVVLVGLVLYGAHRTRTRHLRHRQQALEREVAERTRELRAETQKTEQQAERLREMDRVKSRLFVNVSHEFRTPLTLTIGPLEDLQAELERAEPRLNEARLAGLRRHADLALRNSRRLLRLITQLLDVAKLEAGDLRLDARRQDLGPFVHGIARSFEPLAERRRVRLTVAAPEGPVAVCFDAEKLEQVLVNLLSNAFKFTPEGGAIQVALARDGAGGVATVAVRDSGSGIAAEALPHLFERFYQAEPQHAEVQPGTGIGLSLARDLAELHGGSVEVESTPGLGSTFTVRLPLAEPLPSDGKPEGDGVADGEPAAGSLPTLALAAAPPEGDGAVPEVGLPEAEIRLEDDRTTVLVADDNAEIRAYVRDHLEPRYRVIEAVDGAAALAQARAALPDLIVSDVMMPALDGLGLVRALRADSDTDFVPVVLLSARAAEADRVEGLGEGADAYLSKPFSVRELQAVVERLITSRRRLRERLAASAPDGLPDRQPAWGTREAAPSGDAAFLGRVRAAVEAHIGDENFGVEALAAAVEQSRSTLHRRLRDLVGQSPTSAIRGIRLEHAADLLRERRGSVSEIAYAVGFRSVSHFCQAFRSAYGVTPAFYAASVCEQADTA